jgi:hypothetical protein
LDPTNENQAQATDDPRWIRLRPSRRSMALTVLASIAALGVIGWVPLPFWLRVAFIVLWAGASIIEFRAQGHIAAGAVMGLRLFDRDPARVGKGETALGIEIKTRRDTTRRAGVVLTGCFVTSWFTAIRYRLDGDARWRRVWPRVVPLWPDSLDAEPFRELRVMLKWK